jgi:transcription termination factor NusB
MAEEAVAADAAMEARAQKEVHALFNWELEREKQQREQTDNFFEEVKAELEKIKYERDFEKDSLLKDRAAIESEKKLLHQLKQEVDEQLQVVFCWSSNICKNKW